MISENHERLADAVSSLYRRIDWKKMTSKKRSAVDVLTDRLRVAGHEPDILKAFEKLCASLHVPYFKTDVETLNGLYENNDAVMDILREHTGYIAVLAQKKAKETRENWYEN